MIEEQFPYLQARFTKLYFTLVFLEDTSLPVHKTSALRGGMGEMLLCTNCVRNRNCEQCDFEPECIVRRIMYSRFDIKPRSVTKGDSIGYVLECEDLREEIYAGDELEFQMILFGKTIVYLNQILQAFAMLGMCGLGKEHSRFRVSEVKNIYGEILFDGEQIFMERYPVATIGDYVNNRMRRQVKPWNNRMVFHTPLTLKYHGEFLQEFQMEPIVNAVRRRIYMLNCFEGIEDGWPTKDFMIPKVVNERHRFAQVDRYSSRQGSKMTLKGIEGQLQMDVVEDDLLVLLLAGELIHIGKNTSFGFGRYHVD